MQVTPREQLLYRPEFWTPCGEGVEGGGVAAGLCTGVGPLGGRGHCKVVLIYPITTCSMVSSLIRQEGSLKSSMSIKMM